MHRSLNIRGLQSTHAQRSNAVSSTEGHNLREAGNISCPISCGRTASNSVDMVSLRFFVNQRFQRAIENYSVACLPGIPLVSVHKVADVCTVFSYSGIDFLFLVCRAPAEAMELDEKLQESNKVSVTAPRQLQSYLHICVCFQLPEMSMQHRPG